LCTASRNEFCYGALENGKVEVVTGDKKYSDYYLIDNAARNIVGINESINALTAVFEQ
jgi:hypothetical protein